MAFPIGGGAPGMGMFGASLPLPFNSPGMSPEQAPPPPLPDPSNWELSPPPPIPEKFFSEIFDFVSREMAAGAELIRNKLSRWKHMEKLVRGTMTMSGWNRDVISSLSEKPDVVGNAQWQSDFVLGAAPVVHSFADRMHADLFSMDKYYQVEKEPGIAEGSVEDPIYSTSDKFQALLLHELRRSRYQTRWYELLMDGAAFGSLFAIPFYFPKKLMRWRKHPMTGQIIPVPENDDKLVLESVPLHSVIPDVRARNSDTQRWTGVGRRIEMSYSQIVRRFKQGIFNANEEEFMRAYSEGVESLPTNYQPELWRDRALNALITGRLVDKTMVAWEWHGEVPVDDNARELIVTILTPRPTDEPTAGIMVRCSSGPALPTGHRPILCSHFTPLPGAFGDGAVEPNLDLIYYMSNMINILIDNARLSTNVQYKMKRHSSLVLENKKQNKGNEVYPGKVWLVDEMDDIVPFEPANFPHEAMTNLIQYFGHMKEERSGVSDSTLAVASRSKTAHESENLRNMADMPLKSRLNIVVENVFEPAGAIFVGMLQTNMRGAATVPVPGRGNEASSMIISAEEIRTGSYRVIASFNTTDQLSMAKAQAMERMTPLITRPDVKQLLLEEGRSFSMYSWLTKFGMLLGLDSIEGFLPMLPPQQAETMKMIQQMPPEMLQGLIQQMMMAAQQQKQGAPPGGPNPNGNGGQPPQPQGTRGTPLGTDDRSNLGLAIQGLQESGRGMMQ